MSKVQKAWFYSRYGSLDVLQFGDFPLPTPDPGEVLVKVKAAALNPVDFKRRQGVFGDHDSNFTTVPGCDVSGVVDEVGEGVSKFQKGDHVYGDIFDLALPKPSQLGTLAQYTAAHEKLFALKPSNLSFKEAASLPLALQTAQQPFEFVNFQKGQTVFIVGGAGGVGTLAIQVAKHIYGASRIVATASTPKLDFVKSLGADEAVDYTKQSYEQIPSNLIIQDCIELNQESYGISQSPPVRNFNLRVKVLRHCYPDLASPFSRDHFSHFGVHTRRPRPWH